YWKEGVIRKLNGGVSTVFVDREQRVWVGTRGGGLRRVLPDAAFPQPVEGFDDKALSFVSAIHQDRQGRLWVGTQQGLARWQDQEWKTYTTRDGLSANRIRAIADDPAGNVWIGTETGGLNRWRDGQFTAVKKSDTGLPSDNVSSLYVDDDGVLWIG